MAVATTTMAEFLVAAQAAFEARFGDAETSVLLPDGYALKVKQGYDGAMIVLAAEFAARDSQEEQGGFDTPALTTLQVRVYTAVGFAEYAGKPNAYQAGLARVSDIIGWCGKRRFIEGQRGLEFISMETVDYDVTESFQMQWLINFAAPLRFDHDATDDDPIARYGDYTGSWPLTRVRARVGDPDDIPNTPLDLIYEAPQP